MLYKYIIPSGIQAEIDKSNYGREVMEKLNFYLKGEVSITEINNENEFLISHLWISKPKKNSGPRYIWFETRYKEACVYALRKIYQHDEYDREVNEATKEKWLKKNPFTDADTEEINKTLEQMLSKDKRKFLPGEYRSFEENRRPIEWDELVYESDEWRNKIVNISYEEKINVHRLLNRIAYSDLTESKQHGIILSCRAENCIVYFRIITKQNQQIESLFLLYLQTNIDLEEEQILQLLHTKNYDIDNQNELLKRSFIKSYSIYVLLDVNPKDWIDIEDYDKPNLSLSQEEWKMLREIKYPFFISGLSGSGKSTILQYLFAILYSYQAVKYPKHRLLFLSYSEKLADNAKESVSSLLLNPANKFNISELLKKESERRKLSDCFLSFITFIKNEFLDKEEKKDIFSDDKRINYEKFKEYYENDCKLPERRKYSSALVWSIIRTYIKGMAEQGEFLPEDYAKLNHKRITKIIEQEDYVNIYKIYKQFYSKLYKERKGWDDMDLIRYALNKVEQENAYEHLYQFSAVFCDEMQDFTKLELSLIFKLTVHSQYRMDGSEDLKLPIALAGDPNQTISPTGFSLSSIQEIFKEVFNNNFDREKNINSYELKNNYRSKEQIVKFANTIHLIRHTFFNNRKPDIFQEAWNIDNPAIQNQRYVSFICCDDDFEVIKNSFRMSNIITADDGEYKLDDRGNGDEYTQKRKKLLCFSEINGKTNNEYDHRLYTALSSKGLEFSTTILYRFSSDDSINLFTKKLQGDELSTSETFKLSHYFTKLYISMTRARNALLIVDTQEGYEKFWRYFIQNDCWQILKGQLSISENDLLRLGRLGYGDLTNFKELLGMNFHPEEDAKTLFKIASKNKDKEKMLRAAKYYHDASSRYMTEEELCNAYILYYDKKYKEAGDSFLKLNYISEAVDCYWNGCFWDLAVSCDEPTDEKSKIERNIALCLCYKESWESLLKYLQAQKYDLNKIQELYNDGSNYSSFLNILKNKIEIKLNLMLNESIDDVKSFSEGLDYFFNNDAILSNSRAFLYYKASNYKRAVQLWEIGNVIPKPDEYYLSKIEIDPNDSNKIKSWNHLNLYDEIINKYGDSDKASSLDFEAQKIVFDILLSKFGFKKGLEYPYKEYDKKYNALYKCDKQLYLYTLLVSSITEIIKEKWCFEHKNKALALFKKKIEKQDYDWFLQSLDTELLRKIFSSNDWNYYKELKASDGSSIIEKYSDRSIFISAVAFALNSHIEDAGYSVYFLKLIFSDDKTYKYADMFLKNIYAVLSKNIIKECIQLSENKELKKEIILYLGKMLCRCKDNDYDDSIKTINLYVNFLSNPADYMQTLVLYESILNYLDQNSCKAIIKWIKVKMGYLKIVHLSSTKDVLEEHMNKYCLSVVDIVKYLEQNELLSMLQRIDNSELKFGIILELLSQQQSSCKKFESILRKVFPEEISYNESQNSGKTLFLNYCVDNSTKIHDDNLLRIIKIKLLYLKSRFSKNIDYAAELKKIFGENKINWQDISNNLSEDETIYLFSAMLKSEKAMDVIDSFLQWANGKYTYFSRLYKDFPELQSDLMKTVISHFSLLFSKKKRKTTLVLITAVRSMFSNQNVKEIYNAFINEIEKEKNNLSNCSLNENGRVEPYYLEIKNNIKMNLKEIK